MKIILSLPVLFLMMGLRVGAALPPVTLQLAGQVEERPLLVTHDGQGRTFVVEQAGKVHLLANGKTQGLYLDLSDKVYSQGECGLLSIAFHPQFASNGLIYANYVVQNGATSKAMVHTADKEIWAPVTTIIAEFHADPKAEKVDIKTERVVMKIDQPYENHKGGMIAFGPDGMLYIGMGDGGNQRDPHRNGQNLNILLAKMLRIDVTPREGYAIPKDNPFIEKAGAKPEIYAVGLRNPWRWSFDRETGLLYEGDVGEDRWEEVNIIEKGANYGWSVREGGFAFNRLPVGKEEKKPTDPPEKAPGFTNAIKVYWHDEGQSITGGYVYRGKAMPQFRGWYIYGDYSKGTIWALKYENGKVVGDEVVAITNEKEVRPMLPSGFGEDTDGEIYICSHQDGKIWKLTPAK